MSELKYLVQKKRFVNSLDHEGHLWTDCWFGQSPSISSKSNKSPVPISLEDASAGLSDSKRNFSNQAVRIVEIVEEFIPENEEMPSDGD